MPISMLYYINNTMSLFKLKNLWIQTFPQQQFDEHHLAIGVIDGQPAIALVSFAGIVRVFVANANSKSQLSVQLIYEVNLEMPVVGVQFVLHPEEGNRNTIGVLVYKKFYYIALSKSREGNGYEARNIQINVQPAFAIQKRTLSLMTINSTIQYLNPLSSQKIKVSDPIYPFVREEDAIYYADGEQLVKVQNSAQQWRIVVGPMRNLFLISELVIAIGDNALWQIKQSDITKTKVMDEDISYGVAIRKEGDYNILVANFANQIFIYNSNYSLIWAMKANEVPIKICVFGRGQLQGALAILGEEGTVSISYLGSEQPETQIQSLTQQINMEQVQAETKKMLSQLKQKEDDSTKITNKEQQIASTGTLKLILTAKPPKKAHLPQIDNPNSFFTIDGELWCCQLQCLIRPQKQTVYDVTVTVRAPSNITCLSNDKKFASIKSAQKCEIILLCSSEKFAYDNFVEVVVRYECGDRKRETSVTIQKCELPMNFQCSFKSLELEEKPTNKIVFKAQNDLPAFSQIFHQFEKQLSNKLPNGVLCSMGYNKNNTKVKIQSNLFSGLCFMFVVFNSRFQKLVKSKKVSQNQLSIDDIPLEQFFTLMKDHFGLRGMVKQKSDQLEKKCEQFRNTQKKLIIKMKQKVSSINNIDKLLEYTYKKLIQAADSFEQTRQEMESVNHNLEIALKFVMELLFMKTKATSKCRQKVQGIIGYQKQCPEYGWQEKILSNSSHFLNKKFNYVTDKYSFDQLYKTALWVISKINSGEWNQ